MISGAKCFFITIGFKLILGLFVQSAMAQPSTLKVLKKPNIINDFELLDQSGKPFGLANLKNQWSLVFLGFTHCPDICPLTMSKLEAVRAELGSHFTPDKIPNIVFVGVDPDRDKPIIADYLKHFHPKNIGVTGDAYQLDILVKSVDGFYRLDKKSPTATSKYYNVVHTSSIAVINPKAEMIAKISPPFNVSTVSRDLMLLIRRGHLDE
jgi:protein SCO1/2